ncbi:PIG-L family deacetylase [Xylanimonas protaetiae]|uniref:GlcNAc-PI de-N-acetylase n=1 Tax=Xylanimonas protaetiae TaxID=2509457 RepID=A0A4P6F318_9MICO|nr:PIG-L family deacetylase [Xylanimonas protaetiae]QAY69972.1 hypothetical protein ET471_07955 [Xylanimonas protaetiae]
MTSILNVVAHQDDDLYFLSPDILHDVDQAGTTTPIGTLYLTAGNAGLTWASGYAQSRENGVRAAWAQMAGVANTWTTSTVTLAGKAVTVSALAGTQIKLVFVRLPDGGEPTVPGEPDTASAYLMRLWTGATASVVSLDGANEYTRAGLIALIAAAIDYYGATVIRHLNHLAPYGIDHVDHVASAKFASAGADAASTTPARQGYMGYGQEVGPVNVSGADYTRKMSAASTYVPFDTQFSQVLTQYISHQRPVLEAPTAIPAPGAPEITAFTQAQRNALVVQDDDARVLGTAFYIDGGAEPLLATAAACWLPSGYLHGPARHYAALMTASSPSATLPDTYLAGGTVASVTPGSLARIAFERPVLLEPGRIYWVTWFFPQGGYPSAADFFATSDAVSAAEPRLHVPGAHTDTGDTYVTVPPNGQYRYTDSALYATPGVDNSYGPISTWYGVEPVLMSAVAASAPHAVGNNHVSGFALGSAIVPRLYLGATKIYGA